MQLVLRLVVVVVVAAAVAMVVVVMVLVMMVVVVLVPAFAGIVPVDMLVVVMALLGHFGLALQDAALSHGYSPSTETASAACSRPTRISVVTCSSASA